MFNTTLINKTSYNNHKGGTMMNNQTIITVNDLQKSVEWYTSVFGFEKLEEKEDSIDLKLYDKFALRIHKVLDDTNEQRGDGVTLRFELDNFDEMLSNLQRQSIQIVEGPYFNSETALSEAMILDSDGYEIVLTGRSFYPAQPKE